MAANLQLSAAEMALVSDTEWILTKNSIIVKTVELFAEVAEEQKTLWEVVGPSPKIARGESYRGLPYVMLDYPRLFGRDDVFAIRTMFWWGHDFTVTLHLKGSYLEMYLPVIREQWRVLTEAGFYIGMADDEWEHAHTPEYYRPWVAAEDLAAWGSDAGDGMARPFLKLSARLGLDRWEEAYSWMIGKFAVLAGVLQ